MRCGWLLRWDETGPVLLGIALHGGGALFDLAGPREGAGTVPFPRGTGGGGGVEEQSGLVERRPTGSPWRGRQAPASLAQEYARVR